MSAVHQPSFDGWNPALMDELVGARSGYAVAFDRLWRDERLLRYVHWLREQPHPDFNMVGSWCDADINAEIGLWRQAARHGYGDEDVIETVRAKLEERFGFDLAYAKTLATDSRLASAGCPVWNDLTGSLLPQSLGRLQIDAAIDYGDQPAGVNMGYSYRVADESSRVDLYIFTGGEHNLGNGVDDPRVVDRFASEWRSLQQHHRAAEANEPTQTDPMIETLQDSMNRKFSFFTGMFTMPTPTKDVLTGLSVTAFCNVFLKVRVTFDAFYLDLEAVPDSVQQSAKLFETDLAEFCCHYSRTSG